MATGPAWLFVALKVDGHDSDYLQKKLFPATTVGSQPALGRATRRATKAIGDLLAGTAGGVYGGNLFCTVLDDSGTRAAGAISCTQANATGNYVRWTYGSLTRQLTEGTDFSRGANDAECAENLAAAGNADDLLRTLYTFKANVTAEADLVALANDIKANYNAHLSAAGVHNQDDETNVVATADATDTASAIALLNAIKAAYNAHRVDTTVHDAADNTNAVAAADATTLTTAITLADEIKMDYNAHRSQSGVHDSNDSGNQVTESSSAPGTVTVTANMPTQLIEDVAMSTDDGTAFGLTQVTGGTEGAAKIFLQQFWANRSP